MMQSLKRWKLKMDELLTLIGILLLLGILFLIGYIFLLLIEKYEISKIYGKNNADEGQTGMGMEK